MNDKTEEIYERVYERVDGMPLHEAERIIEREYGAELDDEDLYQCGDKEDTYVMRRRYSIPASDMCIYLYYLDEDMIITDVEIK